MQEHVELVKVDKEYAVINLTGRLDLHISESVEQKLNEIIAKNNVLYAVINMSKIDYISSSGLRVMLTILRHLKDKGGNLLLSSLTIPVKRTFDVIEVSTLFGIYNTDEEALLSLKS